jgi:MFS transporter, FHS family, Na+ dependent glucose transporter 1
VLRAEPVLDIPKRFVRAPALPLVQTAAYYLAFVALGLAAASLGPTLPGLAAQTHSPLRDVSFLFAARAFGYLLGSYVGGRGYDRIAGHPLMGAMLGLMALMLVLTPLLPWLALLTVVLFALGLGEGALDVGGNTLLVWAQRSNVGSYLNGLHFFFGVGAFLSPLLIALAVGLSGGILAAYWLLAFLLLPSIAWLLRVPGPSAQHNEQPGAVLQVNRPLLLLVVLFFFAYTGAEGAFGGWVYSYALAMRLSDETTAAYLTSAFWGALTLGRLLVIPLALKAPPGTILAADLAGCLLSLGVIVLGAHSLLLTWVGVFGLGLCMASIFPTMLGLAGQRMTITGQITGWFFVGASAGNMFLPWLIGQLFESAGPLVVPVLLGTDIMAACALFAIVMLRSRSIALDPPANSPGDGLHAH